MANTGFVNCSHFKHQILVDDNTRYRQQLTHPIGKIRPTSILYEAGNILAAVKLGEQVIEDALR
jgi:hypothetical protein